MSEQRIAFLGLGLMGLGMARRLLSAGFPLTVYNRSAGRAVAIRREGAQVAASPREAAADAHVVFSMVADDEASRAIWFGDDGALANVAPGAILIECSTLSPGWIEELAAAATARGCELLDAPVTGSKPQAAAGELSFLVGGSEAALQRALPLFQAMGRRAVHLGPGGSGAMMKLINNFVCGVQAASLAEAVLLIEKSDLDPQKALGVLLDGAPGSPLVKTLAARMASADYTTNFALRLMAKDLSYALQEAQYRSLRIDTAAATLSIFRRAIDAGLGDSDFSAVVELLRMRAQ